MSDGCGTCGNNIVESGEECDDGNTTSGDGCDESCNTEFCGDNITQAGIGEECDGTDDAACPGLCQG